MNAEQIKFNFNAVTRKGGIAPLPIDFRFWSNVRKTDSCWLWTKSVDWAGYGKLGSGGKHGGWIKASVFSWILHYGPVPKGKVVCHNCPGGDNPRCVNPAHLWIGTQAENCADTKKKGRSTKGDKDGMAKFTWPVVDAIRAAYPSIKAVDLAHKYGVCFQNIYKIINNEIWVR